MMHLSDWSKLIAQGIRITAVESYPSDRQQVIEQFYQWGTQQQQPVYFWNSGYFCLMQVVNQNGQCILQATELGQGTEDKAQWLLERPQPSMSNRLCQG